MNKRYFQFHEFRLDTSTRELRHSAGRVSILPARVYDCVLHLIDHRDRAVGRDELIAAVWNQSEVGDNVLAQLLARTRKILEDAGTEQRVIRTVPGFGYRWIAATQAHDTEVLPSSATRTTLSTAPAGADLLPPRTASTALRVGLVTAGLALAAALAVATFRAPRPDASNVPSDLQQSTDAVAVLDRPALVLPAIVEGDSGQEWLRLGIMALVTERLDGAGRSTVPSDNSVALTHGKSVAALDDAALAELARSAGANWILQPRVVAAGSRWRVSLTLVHGEAPVHLAVTAEASEVLDAARQAVDRLLAGTGSGAPAAETQGEEDVAVILKRAQSAYLNGKPELAHDILSIAQHEHADSSELAYQLGWTEYLTGRLNAAQERFEHLATEPLGAVERARALNGLAHVRYQRRSFAEVEQHTRAAIALLEGRADGVAELGRAWYNLATVAGSQGHYEESAQANARARVLFAAAGNWLGVARADSQAGINLRRTGRLSEAIPVLTRAADRLQEFHEAWLEGVVRSHLAAASSLLAEPLAALAQEPRLAELDARIEHPGMRASMKLARADLLLDAGRVDRARPLIADAYAQIVERDDRLNLYFAHALAAREALASDNAARAETEAGAAIATLSDPEEDPRHVAETFLLLIQLQLRHDPSAAQATRQKLAAFANARAAPLPAYLALADAQLALGRGDDAAAKNAFEQAAAASEGLVPVDRLRIAQAYVPWLLRRGDTARAAEMVGRLGDISYRNFAAAELEARLYLATRQRAAWQAALDRADALANGRAVARGLRDGSAFR
jgi:DNA-binding winged helix-turn-helix (wHTH) protein